MTKKDMSKITLASLAFVSSSALANPGESLNLMTKELLLTREEIFSFGFDVTEFKNSAGQIRSLYPNELVKVRIHEETGAVDFSSFDDFSHVVFAGTNTPRNIF